MQEIPYQLFTLRSVSGAHVNVLSARAFPRGLLLLFLPSSFFFL